MKTTLGRHGARNRRSITGIGHALALGLTGMCGSVHAAYSCTDLAAVTTADSTVTSAAPVAAGTTINGSLVSVPMCRVQGVARPSSDSEIKFEVWLPPTADGVDRPPEGQRHRRLRRRHPVCAARAGHRRRLRHRRQQHGPRRRRVAELDAGPSGEGQGLGPARALLGRHGGQGARRRASTTSRCSTRTSRAARTAAARR